MQKKTKGNSKRQGMSIHVLIAGVLPAVVGVAYLIVGIYYFLKKDPAWGMVWSAYALANWGLVWKMLSEG